jgi:hypothetical protein
VKNFTYSEWHDAPACALLPHGWIIPFFVGPSCGIGALLEEDFVHDLLASQ